MKLRHFANVYSDYDFIDVHNEGESVEIWTYLVYTNKEYSQGIKIEFEIHYEPEQKVELVRATTVMYGEHEESCPMCGKNEKEMELCSEFEAKIDDFEKEHTYLHECGFTKDEILDLAIEIFIDDNFDDILTQESFDDAFIIEKMERNHIVLYETYSTNRYVLNRNKVYHVYKRGIETDECPFCECMELVVHDEGGNMLVCSVLTKHIQTLKKLINNSKQEPVELPQQ